MQPSKINIMDSGNCSRVDDWNRLVNINKVRLLNGFSENEIREFYSLGYVRDYVPDDLIISDKHDDMNVYIILDGKVSLRKLGAPVMRLLDGEAFNEGIVFCPRADTVIVRAEINSRVFSISREILLGFFLAKPERLFKIFTLNVMSILQQKIVYYECRIVQYHFQNKNKRGV